MSDAVAAEKIETPFPYRVGFREIEIDGETYTRVFAGSVWNHRDSDQRVSFQLNQALHVIEDLQDRLAAARVGEHR